MDIKKPYPKSAPGPFVVNDGECIGCGGPELEAPDLMAFDKRGRSCFFKKGSTGKIVVVAVFVINCCHEF